MRQRQSQEQPRQTGPSETPSSTGGDDLSALHAQSQQFLNAGNQILRAALSGNSQDFIEASRQHSGQ